MRVVVAMRKRVVHLPDGREIDFGAWDLRDFIMPSSYAARDLYTKAYSGLVARWEELRDLVNAVGLGTVLAHLAWDVVVKDIAYRQDSPVFNAVDFWMLPNETWSQKRGDCEDISFLLQSALEMIADLEGGVESYAVIGFYREGTNYYGHAYVLMRSEGMGGGWLWLETTIDEPLPVSMWYSWNPDTLIPVYWFSSRRSYRVLEDYAMLGLDASYVERHRNEIEEMVNYVETGKRMKVKWMHKGRRIPKVVDRLVVA